MKKCILVIVLVLVLSSSFALAENGMVNVRSTYGVAETADRLEAILQDKGMTIMARVNHAQGAADAGMELRPTVLFVFGNSRVGTPLMQCRQTVAIDLPQKMLIWEDESNDVWLTYNDPVYLKERHAIQGCEEALDTVQKALDGIARSAGAR